MSNQLSMESRCIRTFNLVSTLLKIINENDEENIDVFLSKYLLSNLFRLQKLSIYEVSEECYVSRSSIQRFIKKIGFDSYKYLKSALPEAIDHQERYIRFYLQEHFQEQYKHSIIQMLDALDKIVMSPQVIDFIELLHHSNVIVISFADSTSLAPLQMQEAFCALQKPVRCITNASKNESLLHRLTSKDLLITLSMTGNYGLVGLKELKDVSAHKVLLTVNHSKIFHKVYDTILYLKEDESGYDYIQEGIVNPYTIYGFTYFFDLIIHQYYKKYGKHVSINR